ncbi:MAG: hypothetical protein HFF50_01240 [Lawsonibacter sp.]|nr:hypothetical protein [Lawsonibacter sp.]
MNKAILASMLTSMFMVLVLSTLNGDNAVIAPIIILLVASVGMTSSTLAVIMQTAGVTGLFISPFSPPMVTIMELTGMTYPQVLLYASLPVCVPLWIITYLNAKRVQKLTAGIHDYPEGTALSVDDFQASPDAKRATGFFSVAMLLVVAYGIVFKLGVAHAITVITVAVLAVGFGARFKASKIIDLFMKGCAQYFWIFMLFILMDPFLSFIQLSGAFDALMEIGTPLIEGGGKIGLAMLASAIGTFGVQGAAVAQAVMMDTVFHPLVEATGLSMKVWALVILIGSQMTSFRSNVLCGCSGTTIVNTTFVRSRKQAWQTRCGPLGIHSAVVELHQGAPMEIGGVLWSCLGSPLMAPFLPHHYGITEIAPAFLEGNDSCEDRSAFWSLRKLTTLAMTDIPQYFPVVTAEWEKLEKKAFSMKAIVEQEAASRYEDDPDQARGLLTDFAGTLDFEALKAAKLLEDTLHRRIAGNLYRHFAKENLEW